MHKRRSKALTINSNHTTAHQGIYFVPDHSGLVKEPTTYCWVHRAQSPRLYHGARLLRLKVSAQTSSQHSLSSIDPRGVNRLTSDLCVLRAYSFKF